MNYWETKKLSEMTHEEWESLCDNCGKCCLHKLEDEDTGDIYFTSVACDLIDLCSNRCTHYAGRTGLVPDCLDLRQLDISNYHWLPSTCAYRLLSEDKELPVWHPLITGSQDSVKEAGVSISPYAFKGLQTDDLEDYIIEWME